MQKLKDQIAKLEQHNVSDKPWMLKGEISSSERPKNSLLEVALDYDHTAKVLDVYKSC
jgi:U3 small nucleolar RNA-associated protein MPP10